MWRFRDGTLFPGLHLICIAFLYFFPQVHRFLAATGPLPNQNSLFHSGHASNECKIAKLRCNGKFSQRENLFQAQRRSFVSVAQLNCIFIPTGCKNLYFSVFHCHCDDNCLVGRTTTTRRFTSKLLSRSKALLALAVCLAGCDEELRGDFSEPFDFAFTTLFGLPQR